MADPIKTPRDLDAHLGFMVLAAPGKFPKVGPFTDDQAQNLEVAFRHLREGLHRLKAQLPDPSQLPQVEKVIDSSFVAYRDGDSIKGARLLQDVQDMIFPNRFKEHESKKNSRAT